MNDLILIFKKDNGKTCIKLFKTGASLRRYLHQSSLKEDEYFLIEGKVLKTLEGFTTTKGEHLCHG